MSVANEVKEFYANDIVYRFDRRKRINFGVVVDSYEATDSDDCGLQKGQISVWWLNSSRETVWKQSKVRLMSRSVIPGDIVRRLENGKETQRGYCKESKQYATVQIVGTDRIIERVTSERLSTVSPLEDNVAVCLENKYGRIQCIDQKVTMQSKCGSTVEIISSINHDVEDYWFTKRNRNYFENYYPGQEVTCTPNSLEQPNWLSRSKAMKRSMLPRQRFTVQKVEPTDIEVAWYDSMSSVSVSGVNAEDIPKLKVIEPVENAHLELAERRLLKLNSSDNLIKKRDWIRKQSALHQPEPHKVLHIVNRTSKKDRYCCLDIFARLIVFTCRGPKLRRPSLLSTCVNTTEPEEGWWTEEGEEESSDNGSSSISTSLTRYHTNTRHFPPKLRELVPGHTIAVEVLCMDSKATIVWQDGTEEKDIPTTQLYYSISLDDHEFFPGEWVVQEGKTEKQYGAIQHVNHLERTAMVKWFTCSEDNQKPELVLTNEMSVYDLRKHPKYAFRPGSVVKRIPLEENKLGSVLDSCPEGYVIVEWIDGTRENCWPHNLELIPETIDLEYSIDDNDDSAQESWETQSIESIAGDLSDETTLQNMAARLDFVRGRVIYLKEILKQRNTEESFSILKELLMIYDNSSFLDKLLDTSFFSLKSRHFQVLLAQIKEKAKSYGIELRGRFFTTVDNLGNFIKSKNPEKENINKVMKLEHKLNAQLDSFKEKDVAKESGEPSTPLSPDSEPLSSPHENICVELLSMMKVRMDLAYAEIISRIGGPQALSVMTKASDATPVTSTPLPSLPTTPDDSACALNPLNLTESVITCENDVYSLLDEVHVSHRFYNNKFEPTDRQRFFKAVQKEFKLLKESLPPGVWVRSYANRMDLLSVMIRGPSKTPYEDGLFLFDLQLSQDYPRSPPVCHYISYSSERLNPNLYVEGKVCISLLGTWMGRGTEMWNTNSTLLQLIVSIQGLVLVSEPYYNEAGYEKQVESQQGYENSRTYNELVILKLVQSMTEMLLAPPDVFKQEIYCHFAAHGEDMCTRLQRWCNDSDPLKPEFPLLPVSKGLKLSLNASLNSFQDVLKNVLKANASPCDAGIVSSEPHV